MSLLLADEPEPALRWSAAALERDPFSPGAIIITARVLSQMGRTRPAMDGLFLAVQRSIECGDLPLAIVAIDQLRGLGVNVAEPLNDVADAFCRDSGRLHAKPVAPRSGADFQPLSPLLTGEPLAEKATQILLAAKHAQSDAGAELAASAPPPLFSALSRESLRAFLDVLETTFVPSGHRLLQEGKDSGAAYIVASGSLEIARRSAEGARGRSVLGRVGSGALVGEVALMSHLPSAVSVTATAASILLVARRSSIEPVAARYAELGIELSAFCRRHAVANLGWASTLVAAVPAAECADLVERLETRTYDRGEKLVAHGEDAQGLHLIVSGEVAVVAREGGGRVMLGTRSAGETVGEVELVLCQRANIDAIAVRSTATLLLPPEEFFALVRESPATLHGLYAIAVRRHAELRRALDARSMGGGDEWALDEATADVLAAVNGANPHRLGESGVSTARGTPPPPLPREAIPPTPTPPPLHSYEPKGSGARASRASNIASPFAPASSFVPPQVAPIATPNAAYVPPGPAGYGGTGSAQAAYGASGAQMAYQTPASAQAAHGAPGPAQAPYIPQPAANGPASFIPPAAAVPSPLAATQQSTGSPASPFMPPHSAPGASFGPSVSPVPPPRANRQGTVMMVLAGITTAIAIVLLTVHLLGKRPSDLLAPAPAAPRPYSPAETSLPVQLAPAAPVAAPQAAAPPPVAPVTQSTPSSAESRATVKTHRTHRAKDESPPPGQAETSPTSAGASTPAPFTNAAASSTPASSASASVSTPAQNSSQVSSPASASSDDFGSRQ